MRRFTIGFSLLLLVGIPVAAVVRAQESESQESSSWSQRWGQLKKNFTGDNQEGSNTKRQDWSAGRKFGGAPKSARTESRPDSASKPESAPSVTDAPRLATPQQISPKIVEPATESPVRPTPAPQVSSRRTAPAAMQVKKEAANSLRPESAPTPAAMPETVADSFTNPSNEPASVPTAAPARGPSLQERIAASRAKAAEPDITPIEEETPEAASSLPFPSGPEVSTKHRNAIVENASVSPLDKVSSKVPYMARAESTVGSAKTTASKETTTTKSSESTDDVLFARKSPLLAVETSGPRSIVIGKEASYTVTIQNSGEVAAQDVVVSIKVPEWADVVNARMTTGSTKPVSASQASEPFQWNISRLEAKSREELVLQLIPRKSKPFDLAVQWTFSPIASQALVEVQEPKLAMTLSGPDEVLYGETKNYSISLSNPGTGAAENVTLELLPLGDGQGGARQTVGTIGPGESKVITVELTARQTGNVKIRAKGIADGGLTAEASEDVLVRRAELEIAIEGPKFTYAGTMVSYNVQVNNPGNATAEAVEISSVLPAGAKLISCTGGGQPSSDQSAIKWTLGSLRSGGDTKFEVKCVLNNAGPNRLETAARATGDLNDKTSLVTAVEAMADLKLEVQDPKGPVPVGEDMTYELHIKNRGSRSAEEIEVLAFFSEGIEPVAVQGGQHEVMPGQVIFRPIGSLAADSDIVYKIKARATESGRHIFRAEVNCQSLGTKLASEETTYFFGDDPEPTAEVAAQPFGTEPASLDSTPSAEQTEETEPAQFDEQLVPTPPANLMPAGE